MTIAKETAIFLIEYIDEVQSKLMPTRTFGEEEVDCYCPDCDECFTETIYVGDLFDIDESYEILEKLKTEIIDRAGGLAEIYGPFNRVS